MSTAPKMPLAPPQGPPKSARHVTVFIIMDAGRNDYVRADSMPFTYGLAQQGTRGSFESPPGFAQRIEQRIRRAAVALALALDKPQETELQVAAIWERLGLQPGMRYFWTVRARFELDGRQVEVAAVDEDDEDDDEDEEEE